MATIRWIGAAQPRAGVRTYRFINVVPGAQMFMRMANNYYGYVVPRELEVAHLTQADLQLNAVNGLLEQISGNGLGGGNSNSTVAASLDYQNGEPAVRFDGSTDGAPLDVDIYVEQPAVPLVRVSRMATGQAFQKRRVFLEFPITMTGGSYTIDIGGNVTSSLAYNASSATIQTAVNTAIGSGNCTVTGSYTAGFTFEFDPAYDPHELTYVAANSTDVTGTWSYESHIEIVDATTPASYQIAALDSMNNTMYQFSFNGKTSHSFSGAATADDVKFALLVVSGLQSNYDGIQVVQGTDGSFTVTGFPVVENATLTCTSKLGDSVAVTLVEEHTGANTIYQYFDFPKNQVWDAASSFTLNYNGTPASATYANLNDVLVGLGLPFTSDANFFTDTGFKIQLSFIAKTVTLDMTGVVGLAVTGVQSQAYVEGASEIQQISVDADAVSGNYTLTFNGNTTANIAWNASSASVQAALEALASIGAGNVEVLPTSVAPYTAIFRNTLADQALPFITVASQTLAAATTVQVVTTDITTPTGPNWWNNVRNWSSGSVPGNSDSVVFDSGNVDCLYGIQGVAVVLGIDVYKSYTGRIGLPDADDNGVPQTLPQYLSFGGTIGSPTSIRIGLGDSGSGPSRVRIDTASQQATVQVLYSAQRSDDSQFVVGIGGTINSARVLAGSVAFGYKVACTVALLISQKSSDQGDLSLTLGDQAAVAAIQATSVDALFYAIPGRITIRDSKLGLYGVGDLLLLDAIDSEISYWADGKIGQQGNISAVAIASTLLRATSVAHGLVSGDRVYITGLKALSVPDGYYNISKIDNDTFDLLLSAPGLPYGVGAGTLNTYYQTNTAQWGKAGAIDLKGESSLVFNASNTTRTLVAPIVTRSTDVVVSDSLATVSGFRVQQLSGNLRDFGDNVVVARVGQGF